MDNGERRRDEDDEEDEDEDSGMEWEEVVQPADESRNPEASTSKLEDGSVAASKGASDGIEVTLKKSAVSGNLASKGKGKGKGRPAGFSVEAALQRAHRQELHKVHASCLLMSGHVRNGWINDKTLQARLLSKTPLHLQNNFHNYSKTTHPKQHDRSRLFESAVRSLLTLWTEKFLIEDTKPDLLSEEDLYKLFASPQSLHTYYHTDMQALLADLSDSDRAKLMMPFAEDTHLQELLQAFPPKSAASPFKTDSKGKGKQKAPKLPKPVSQELGELIRNPQSLAKRAVKLSGTKDVSVQLFTSLCRALDIPARLVCSLPATDYRSANKMKSDDRTADLRTGGSGKAAGKKRKRAGGDGNASASVSFEDTNNEDDDDEDDEDFEEVAIPSSLPSKALKKGANAKLASNTASPGTASDASTAGRSGKLQRKMSRQKRAASLFADRKGKARAPSYDEGTQRFVLY